ncbi:MAG: hypothetical protein EH225_00250 [Calditrichaeota bacterium]|nr:MAG: hypothetical protein EH225_00250 [Calditrichota bacterium]
MSHHSWLLWIAAFLITVSSAVYQRMTGPTYPVRGEVTVGETNIAFKLLRSETTDRNASIRLQVPDSSITGFVKYRRYKSYDQWTTEPLERRGEYLVGTLPKLPPAGKMMYWVYLSRNAQQISLTGDNPIVLRYKGPVPAFVLIPHVLIMFMAMMMSNRAALEALDSRGTPKKYMLWTIGLFFIGGFILGPSVQKYAFGEFWTGIPFGWDLTDNKTLIGMLGWLGAWFMNRGEKRNRLYIFLAAVLMLAVYLIPHSLFGSEIDYTEMTAPDKL